MSDMQVIQETKSKAMQKQQLLLLVSLGKPTCKIHDVGEARGTGCKLRAVGVAPTVSKLRE